MLGLCNKAVQDPVYSGFWPLMAKGYWEARLIEVKQAGKIRRYITLLMDPKTYPLIGLAKLYAQRWEIKMCYREIKSDLQEGKHLRSKQPDLVYQELWGVLPIIF